MKIWLRTVGSIWLVSLGTASLIMAYLIFVRIEDFPNGLIWKVILILGLILNSLGFYGYSHTHRRIEGIRINPAWITFFYDFVNLIFGILAAFLVINLILLQFNLNTIEDEQFSLFMGVDYYVFGIPFVAYFTTRLSSQVIIVSQESITSVGMWGSQKMKWNDVQDINLKDEYIVTAKSGIIYRRRLKLYS